jgi:glycosyltransferase involved in cell wall biosynthesis
VSRSEQRRLHIGYLIQQFVPEIGAGPARASEYASRWVGDGARVSIYTALPNRPGGRIFAEYRGRWRMMDERTGIAVTRSWVFARPGGGMVQTLANNLSFMCTSVLASARARPRPDVLIASAPPLFVHAAGWLLARYWRVPLVLEVRDLWPDYLAGMGLVRGPAKDALFALERWLFARSDHVVAVTGTFATRIVEKGVRPGAVTVIPNAVDGALYFRDDAAVPPLHSLCRERDVFIVGYLGNIGASQGRLLAIAEAAHRLRDRTDIRFVIAGDGTEGHAFRQRVAELNLPNLNVGGPIPKESTNAFYNCCDACLVPLANVPAIQETIPSKLLEVMACGRPVIASLGGEAAAIVTAASCGIVCPPEDAAAIAAAVARLRGLDPAQRRDMGQRGRRFVMNNFERVTLARRYLQMLTGLVPAERRRVAVPRMPAVT